MSARYAQTPGTNARLQMALRHSSFPRIDDAERDGVDPPYDFPDYVGTRLRHPKQPLVIVPHTLSEATWLVYGEGQIGELDHDLTRQHDGEPIGERIILPGRVLDEDGRPVPHTLVEIWQANAAGRYAHGVDNHAAPLIRIFPARAAR